MHKVLISSFIFLLYSCGSEKTTKSPYIDYHIDDQQFIDELIQFNEITADELTDNRIAKVAIDSGSVSFYKIKKLNLGSMGLIKTLKQ